VDHNLEAEMPYPLKVGLVLLSWPFILGGQAWSQSARAPEVITVGVSEYQNIEETYERYTHFFTEIAAKSSANKPVLFRVAIGTYNEVLDWYSAKKIEVAVLAAMPAAELLSTADDTERADILNGYLGTLGEHIVQPVNPTHNLKELFPEDDDLARSRKIFNADFYYRTTLVVRNDSPLKSVDDLKDRRYKDQIKYIFVRPYSVSGFILPNYFLDKQEKISVDSDQLDFSSQHDFSLKRLLNPTKEDLDGKKLLVAFVFDKAKYESNAAGSSFRRLQDDTHTLDNARIPYNAIIVNHNLTADRFRDVKKGVEGMLGSWHDHAETRDSDFRLKVQQPEVWRHEYDGIITWLADADLPSTLLYRSSLGQIIDDLREYEKSQKETPRLALVLSGGGAKCAYQAGAIAEIEKQLGKAGLDINLVVGTSGGSINALLVALGVTRDKTGQDALENMWIKFQDKDFFQPSLAFRIIFGLVLGLLHALVLTALSLAFARESIPWKPLTVTFGICIAIEFFAFRHSGASGKTIVTVILVEGLLLALLILLLRALRAVLHDWWRVAGATMLLSSLSGYLLRAIPETSLPSWILNNSDWRQHSWAVMKVTGGWAFPWPLVLGMIMVVVGFWSKPRINWNPLLVRILSIAMLATSLFLIWDVDVQEGFLSAVDGIKGELIRGIPNLVDPGGSKVKLKPGEKTDAALEDLSEQILNNLSLPRRDLVITASRLPTYGKDSQQIPTNCGTGVREEEGNSLPPDLYFYLPGQDQNQGVSQSRPPREDDRFISLSTNKSKLLNVVVGSSTIYPIFPSQSLTDICLSREESTNQQVSKRVAGIRIVDGGYIHNSPIDAARRWGATHILVIEASPHDPETDPRTFPQNASYALNFLFEQAQRVDTEAETAGELFRLRPTSDCDRKQTHRHAGGQGPKQCDSAPNPNLDLFDFEQEHLLDAVKVGHEDVGGPEPLFERVTGPPLFRDAVYVAGPRLSD
jgi:predicted acylesterase/phospholipase RssA/ABC-type phosphate/phosphonate transport system substrate-binding protein